MLFAASFLLPHNAQAAITYVQSAQNSAAGNVTTLSKTFSSNNQAGNFIIIWVGWRSASSTVSVSDSTGNAYQSLSIIEFLNEPLRAQIFYARSIYAGPNTVTVNISGSAVQKVVLDIHEYAGVDPVDPLDGEARLNNLIAGTNVYPQSGSVTTTQASDLVFGVAYVDGNISNESPWTSETGYALRQSNNHSGTEDAIATSTGAYSATFTIPVANYWVGEIAAFKAAVGRLQVSSRSDTLSNSQPSSTSNHAFTFTVNSAVSGSSTLALAFPSQFTFPGISYVQSAHNNNSCAGNVCSATFTSPNTAGNLIIVSAGLGSEPATASISDTEGNTYATAVGPIVNGPFSTRYIWYAKNINGGANIVKVTWSTTANFDLEIHEYSGADQTSPLDATSSTIGVGTLYSGSATTTVSNELIFGYGVNSNGETEAGAGFMFREGGDGNGSEDKAAGSGGPYIVTFTDEVSVNWGVLIATFKPASSSAGINCGDVDAATSVQFNFNYPSCAATVTAWGFSAVNSLITLTAPTVSTPNVYVATGTQITINIGSNATVGQQGAHWITNPSTTGIYTISVGGTFGGSGNMLVSINLGVTVQATVAESLALTVSSVAAVNCTADDGASVTAIGTTSTTIPFGNVSLNTFYIGCQDLVVSTNAGNGYSITTQESSVMKTADGRFTIPDTTCDGGTCTESAAAAWTSATHNGLGHTCFNQDGNHDCDSSYSSGTKFRQFANIAAGETAQAIMSSTTPATVTARIKHRLSVGNAQAAGTYTTLITYTILGTF